MVAVVEGSGLLLSIVARIRRVAKTSPESRDHPLRHSYNDLDLGMKSPTTF